MNPSQEANAVNRYKESNEYIRVKNVEIKKKNRDIRFRNFLRKRR